MVPNRRPADKERWVACVCNSLRLSLAHYGQPDILPNNASGDGLPQNKVLHAGTAATQDKLIQQATYGRNMLFVAWLAGG